MWWRLVHLLVLGPGLVHLGQKLLKRRKDLLRLLDGVVAEPRQCCIGTLKVDVVSAGGSGEARALAMSLCMFSTALSLSFDADRNSSTMSCRP